MGSIARHILVIVLLATCSSAVRAQVQWQTDLEAAKRTAAQTNKLVLLHFWASWCKPCLQLESTVFNQPGVGETIEKQFVPVKVNIDHRPTTAREYGVTSIPADVIITPDGQMIEKTSSPRTAAAYVGRMQQVAMKVPNRGLQAYANLNTSPNAVTPPAANPTTAPNTSAPVGVYGQFESHDNTAPFTQAAPSGNPTGAPNGTYGQSMPTSHTNATAPPFGQPAINNFAASGSDNGLPSGPSAFGLPSATQPPANNPPANNPPVVSVPGFQQPNPPVAAQTPSTGDFAPPNAQPQTPPTIADSMPGRSTPQPPAAAEPVWGMDAYCPVALVEGKQWLPGDRRWGVRHEGRVYLFTSDEAKQKFLANPDYYAPVFAGHDPILLIEQRQPVAGHREHGVFYRDRIYLFSSEATLQKFGANPARYAAQVAAMEAQVRGG